MSNAPNDNVGASIINPGTAVTPTAGSEGTANPSAIPASITLAVKTFEAALAPAVTALEPSLLAIPPKESAHHAKVGPNQLRVMPMVLAMLRVDPTLSTTSADDLDLAMNDAAACTAASGALKSVTTEVESTGRLRLETGWQIVAEALSVARKRAARDTTLARSVAAIDAILAKGPRAEQAAHAAVTKQAAAARATARATRAQAEATAAAARAAALQHGTAGASTTTPAEPAPTAPSIPLR